MGHFLNFTCPGFLALTEGQVMQPGHPALSFSGKGDGGYQVFKEAYRKYKGSFVKHLMFDPEEPSLGKIHNNITD